jgi:hypothetical protein
MLEQLPAPSAGGKTKVGGIDLNKHDHGRKELIAVGGRLQFQSP